MKAMRTILLFAIFTILCESVSFLPGSSPNMYAPGDSLNIKVNGLTSVKTQIAYEFYHLTYPKPEISEHKKESIGEILSSYHVENSVYDIKVLEDQSCTVVGDLYLKPDDIAVYKSIITNEYLGHLLLDNLPAVMKVQSLNGNVYFEHGFPIGGAVVNSEDNSIQGVALNNHLDFSILYNRLPSDAIEIVGFEVTPRSLHHQSSSEFTDATVKSGILNGCTTASMPVHIISKPQVASTESVRTIFTYSVKWIQSDILWSQRFSTYLNHDPSRQNINIHWFSIINSILIFVFLTGLVGLILLRTLYQDFAHYSRLAVDEDTEVEREDSGWKLVYADVFRAPETMIYLFTATIGTGFQLTLTLFFTFLFALFGYASPEKEGTLVNIIMILYIITGYYNGYLSSRFYKNFSGTNFKFNFLFTSTFYPFLIFMCLLLLNLLFSYVGSSSYIPFTTLFTIISIWICVNLPLTFFGCYNGYKQDPIEAPVATSGVPREIPKQPWYLSRILLLVICGIVPFGIIFVELYFFLSSFWMGHYYYLYGFLFMVFCLLLLITAEISIVITYSLLCSENYHWWWNSILAPGFCSVYIFIFSLYYFFTSFKMTSLIAIAKCLGYVSMLSLSFFLITGFVGFISSFAFVMAIFGAVKVD